MKISILLPLLFTLSIVNLNAQKKKDLLDKIEQLSQKIKNVELELSKSQQREKLTLDKLERSKEQIKEAENENQNLLKTINGFAAVSKQKADNLTASLETIKQKDEQLKVVNDALATAENEKLRKLTIFKDGLSGVGKIGFLNNVLTIAIANTSLYGEDDTSIVITENGKSSLQKIADLLTKYPEYSIIVEGNSNALDFKKNKCLQDNWDLSGLQAGSIARVFQTEFKIDPKRIDVLSKSEYNTSGVETETRIMIKPTFGEFFSTIKENMKE